jgi:hypothetical protein
VVIHPFDQNDEEAHQERDVRRPQRAQAGPEAAVAVWDADLENEQRDGDGEHTVAERLDARRIFIHKDESTALLQAARVA